MKQIIPFSTYIRRPKRDFLLHLGMCALGAVLGASLLVAPGHRAVPRASVVHFVTYVTNSDGYLTLGPFSQYLSSH